MTTQEEVCWKRVKQLHEENCSVMGKVVSINRGGIIVEVESLRGFVPMSHVPNVCFPSVESMACCLHLQCC